VARAYDLGFSQSCTPEFGRLLRTLAAAAGPSVLAEIGTGVGVGAAWLQSGMRPGARLVTVEADAERARAAAALFADLPEVTVIQGDWREILRHGPFALVFPDAAPAKAAPEVVAALRPGGMAVVDDLTPIEHWPPEWRGRPDPLRDFWLGHPRLLAVEIRLTATTAAILATAAESPRPAGPPDPPRTGGSR
jgi:predicted O-methyltransferase YrrM